MKILRFNLPRFMKIFVFTSVLAIFLIPGLNGQSQFVAYYTKINMGQDWEEYSRTGEFADIIVQFPGKGKLIFWRGNSYLPFWETDKGKWNLKEIVSRSGDGNAQMPDKVNIYSNVEIIKNSPSEIIILWRYLPEFTKGNPHGNLIPENFIEELFTLSPKGKITREIKKGTQKIDDWNNPLNHSTQVLQLANSGIKEVSFTLPGNPVARNIISGNSVKEDAIESPSLNFKFNEGYGDSTAEEVSNSKLNVSGHKTLWKKGVSGTALQFDGYNSVILLPASKAPDLYHKSITIEGWFALGAYPWNWAPLIQQGDNNGYFLGIDSHGYPGFMAKVNGWWHELSVENQPPFKDENHLKLFQWYHIAGVYDKKDGKMSLYINGEKIASHYAGPGGIETVQADVRIGKAGVLREPTEGLHDNLASDFGIDGLIDELKIYDWPLNDSLIKVSYKSKKPDLAIEMNPDMQKRAFPLFSDSERFRGYYSHLTYYETWDNMWRFGEYPDVVVEFDKYPIKFVFWRGVSYIPMLVNDKNQWFTNEFNETGGMVNAPGDNEPMSDKACLSSHARIIRNNPARVVIHWRYRLENTDHHWANFNSETGWGDISDWYYYIYPDGVASKIMRSYSSAWDTWHEWNEQIIVFGEGQHPEDVIGRSPVMTLVDETGNYKDYSWDPEPPEPSFEGNIIQMIHFTGDFSPFSIQKFTRGNVYSWEINWYSVFPTWNHWPTAQIGSSGRNASFADRAGHSSLSHLHWDYYSKEVDNNTPYLEKILMEGLSDKPAHELKNLALSWLRFPDVINVSGGISNGYMQPRRAYSFSWQGTPMSFEIDASETKPVENLCFEIKNWGSRNKQASIRQNGNTLLPGKEFRQGVEIDTDGTYTLVLWLELSATTPQRFEISD